MDHESTEMNPEQGSPQPAAPEAGVESQTIPSGTPKRKRGKVPGWLKILLVLMVVAIMGVVGLFVWLTPVADRIVNEIYGDQSPEVAAQKAKGAIEIQPKAPFTVTQSLDLMGVKVIRLKHSQKPPQDFVVVFGLDPETTNDLFSDALKPDLVEMLGNNLLSLQRRETPTTLSIDEMKTLGETTMQVQGKPMTSKEMQVKFHLSTDPAPRSYSGMLGRIPGADGKETLIISFGREKDYQPTLLTTFFKSISLKDAG